MSNHAYAEQLMLTGPSPSGTPHPPLQIDPVQKAVLHHTLGLPTPTAKRKHVSCSVCQLRFNSQVSKVFLVDGEEPEGSKVSNMGEGGGETPRLLA